MKELEAHIRTSKSTGVVRAIRAAGFTSVTVVQTVPMGADVDPEYVDTLPEVPVEHFVPMMKLELVCENQNVDAYIDIIQEAAKTGERGDDVVLVSPEEDAVRIRSGERGDRAV
jgi:nitrogen regulatory protein P-II 1